MINKKLILYLSIFLSVLLINIVSAEMYKTVYEQNETIEIIEDGETVLTNVTTKIYEYDKINIKNPLKKGLIDYYPNPDASALTKDELKDLLSLYLEIPSNITLVNVSGNGTFSKISFEGVIGKAENIRKEIPRCKDATQWGECSISVPRYCYAGSLVERCDLCGCPSMQACQKLDGKCKPAVKTCSDGTPDGQCSFNKPKYCSNGMLYDNCSVCGCSDGRICDLVSDSCSGCPNTTKIGDIDGDSIEDTLTKTCVKAAGNISNNIISVVNYEGYAGEDLNNDGDTNDIVVRYYDIITDRLINPQISINSVAATISNNIIAFAVKDAKLSYYNIITDKIVNTGISSGWASPLVSNNLIAFIPPNEIYYYNINTTEVTSVAHRTDYSRIGFSNNILAFLNNELYYHDISKNITINTGITNARSVIVSENTILFLTLSESLAGEDLNNDGDTNDKNILRYYDIGTNNTVNTGIIGCNDFNIYKNLIAFSISESYLNKDLNNDSDFNDEILKYYDINTSTLIDTGIVNDFDNQYDHDDMGISISNNIISFGLFKSFSLPQRSNGFLAYITLSKYKPLNPIITKCEFECSERKPHYCSNGMLYDNCSVCGCSANQTCQFNGSCTSFN